MAVAVLTELLLLALSSFVGLMVLALLHWTGNPPGRAGGSILMVSAISSYWASERVLERRGHPAPVLVPVATREPWSSTLWIVLLHVAVAVLGSIVIEVVQGLVWDATQRSILDYVRGDEPSELFLLAVIVVVLAPVAEEALFRGLFFRRLMSASPAAAWMLPALVFAAMHLDFVGLAIYVWIGLVFAHAYMQTGRLEAAILTHAGYNAIALLPLFA